MKNDKNLCVTYFLWMTFGWTGIHHFYLGRDRHAFIWWSTGGGFFFGWVRDLWRIPSYVDEANEEDEFMDNLKRRMKLRKSPPFNVVRFLGELWVSYYYGLLARFALPEETPNIISSLFASIGIATGVYMVGNIGRETGSFSRTWLATLLGYITLKWIGGEDVSYFYVCLVASITFNYYRSYKPRETSRNIFIRLSYLCLGASLMFALFTSFLYFNASITYKDGEKVRLRDAVNHFFKSPAWLDFKSTMWQLYERANRDGWTNFYFEFVKAFDPTGESNAFKVLNLPPEATDEEIRRTYKKLVVKWHPDRCKGDHCKDAEEKFMEIQQAYEILSKRKKRSKSRDDNDRTEF